MVEIPGEMLMQQIIYIMVMYVVPWSEWGERCQLTVSEIARREKVVLAC